MSLRELRRRIGRLAIVGFEGQSVPPDLRTLVTEFDLGGVIYFDRNLAEPRQVADLSREIAGLARTWPFWISVDQEGGRVARLKPPFTRWPPMATLGRSGDDALVQRFAGALAAELVAVGINLDYAPVLDVHTNPRNPIIGDRALAEQAEDVARLGRLIIEALQAAGVAACGKHFPGHGDTSVDSHEDLPVVEHDRARLEAVELVPFRHAVEAGVASIMTAHVLIPAVDDRRPATLAPAVVQHWLKDALHFDGLVVSDDLGMGAIARTRTLPEATVEAVAAGCDVVLLCNAPIDDQVAALEALIRAVESGALPEARIDDAFRRQHATKARLLPWRSDQRVPIDIVGCEAHHLVATEMAAWL